MAGGPGVHIDMTDNKVGPCPLCGAMGSVPDGRYTLMGDALPIIQPTPEWQRRVEGVISILQSAQTGSMTVDEAVAQIARDAPDLAPVVNVFLQGAGQQWQQWLLILLAVLQVILGYLSLHEAPEQVQPSPELIERALDQLQSGTRPVEPDSGHP
jgi:hypothetical protein